MKHSLQGDVMLLGVVVVAVALSGITYPILKGYTKRNPHHSVSYCYYLYTIYR